MTNIAYITDEQSVIQETSFNSEWLKKYETIFSQGNGYMGVRASTEESYIHEQRGTFVAGMFNQFDENEVPELVNAPDLIQMEILVGGHLLDLNVGTVTNYSREINLKTGELTRTFNWETPEGQELKFDFRRIVSFDNRHAIAQQVRIENLSNESIKLDLQSGINGQVTNSGSQHLSEGEKRLFDNKYLMLKGQTTSSEIDMLFGTTHDFNLNGKDFEPEFLPEMDRRKILNHFWLILESRDVLVIEKTSVIHTSRDNDCPEEKSLQEWTLSNLKNISDLGYEKLFNNSKAAWAKRVWNSTPIKIESKDPTDQLAIDFARYHLHVMTPGHDNRMNIGAKGLSGEGYKGHSFWDTEIFMLPYFIYTNPKIARSLLEHRGLLLPSARQKAIDNDYEGAMYPWETAWITDVETTPVWGAADIVTGKSTKILSGFIEQHITADVAYGVWDYVNVTGDREFLDEVGYEIILDTAKFWVSRLEWNDNKNRFEINDVIGPDEYKEHIDNNAYTNYLAHWNMELALEVIDTLDKSTSLYRHLDAQINLNELKQNILDKKDKLYLPQPNEEGVIPQDDTFLTLEIIDVSGYKKDEEVGTLFKDYNLDQVNQMQIVKQSDVMLLIFLMEDLFGEEIKKKNWDYYEPKTMHDSSLSLSTHSALAADLGEIDLSYELFNQAKMIDMGPAMKSSDAGIHAASLGGIWQIVVFGYGGVRSLGKEIRIEPHLPKEWSLLEYSFYWHDSEIKVSVSKEELEVVNTGEEEFSFLYHGKTISVKEQVTVKL